MVEMEGTAEIPHNEVRKEKRSDQSRHYRQCVRHRKRADLPLRALLYETCAVVPV
jgi:hypothetical protein